MSLDELYPDILLDHFKHPRCQGTLENPDTESVLFNPLCGDKINLTMKFKDGRISEVCFAGSGCAISQAGASMLTELARGKTSAELKQLLSLYRAMMRGEDVGKQTELLGDAAALEGVRKFTSRLKCALLACEALDQCLQKSEEKA